MGIKDYQIRSKHHTGRLIDIVVHLNRGGGGYLYITYDVITNDGLLQGFTGSVC